MRYHFIERCRGAFPVRMMCRLLRVSHGGYYDWRQRAPSARERENTRLLRRISEIHAETDGVYGARKIWSELRAAGESCGVHRVARLMRQAGLKGIPSRRRWRSRLPAARPDGVVDHLQRDFTATEPDSRWVSDITYIRTREGWLYLAVVLDLCTRKVAGWSMSDRLRTNLVVQAVLMALWRRNRQTELMVHSDRGTQYTARELRSFLRAHRVTSSMSAVGNCYDNAAMESFFGLLKRERVNRRDYATRIEARADVFDYIERFYNRKRRHGTAGGMAPLAWEQQLLNTT